MGAAWEAADTWWAPRQTCSFREFVPYAKLLGDEDPDKVLEAFRDLAGDWRPHPAAVRGHIHRHDADESHVDVGRCVDPAATPEALAAFADAHRTGERLCTCGFHHPMWKIDRWGVLRCGKCGGLQQGQYYAAEEAELLSAPAILPLTRGAA